VKVTVSTEAHLRRGPDGVVRSDTAGRAYDFWAHYLSAFDQVEVVARVSESDHHEGFTVEGHGVTVMDIDGYSGLVATARAVPQMRLLASAIARSRSAKILRLPSPIGSQIAAACRRVGDPYAVEVVGDPVEVLSTGVVPRPLRPILRRLAARSMRRDVQLADAASYVTREVLQFRYPASSAKFVTHYSSVHLPPEAFADVDRPTRDAASVVTAVGTQSQMYKGHDLLIEAAAILYHRGGAIEVRLVGAGRYQDDLRALANDLGIAGHVKFIGSLPDGKAVREELDRADLVAMPSRTEGLPRALIEAMARGVPCIGSDVGAIPELLESEELFPGGNAQLLAELIQAVLHSPARREEMGVRNLAKARQYAAPVLTAKRDRYYETVRRQRSPTG